ncbi:retrotransposon protein [Cucumis melo var. makuwa]|uniref:Retrotransposon protein n=1 Tax=Cucumis melo var. makuwa TaxID=1194695 RepID=A0A5A7T0Z8_CUCMM|nr:retrotransposon protein [Cucumis melo var. makuwa]
MDQQTVLGIPTVFTLAQRQILLTLELLMNDNKRITYTPSDTRHRIRQLAYFRMIHESDLVCRQSTRMDRRTFAILCHLLRTVSSLSSTEIVDVEEMVAMFLHVLAHDVKNRVIQREFVRSGETVSLHFNLVLLAVVRLYEKLIKRPVPVTNNCNDQRWKCFEKCLSALDGTYIKVNVPATDRPTFRTRSAADSRILRDALSRENGLQVPKGYYYLYDAGYQNAEGFLVTTPRQGMSLSAPSVFLRVVRPFFVGSPYYPLQVQCCTILACCLLHNLINREMTYCDDVDDGDEGDSMYATTTTSEDIQYIETTNEWSQWRDELVESMFTDWQLRNA